MPMMLDNVATLDHRKIRQLREARGWTLAVAADHAGMRNLQQWQQIESGQRRDPGVSTVDRIARALGVKLDELMTDDGEGE